MLRRSLCRSRRRLPLLTLFRDGCGSEASGQAEVVGVGLGNANIVKKNTGFDAFLRKELGTSCTLGNERNIPHKRVGTCIGLCQATEWSFLSQGCDAGGTRGLANRSTAAKMSPHVALLAQPTENSGKLCCVFRIPAES